MPTNYVIEGTGIWVTAENAYNERAPRVESQIIARLGVGLAQRGIRVKCLGCFQSLLYSFGQRYVALIVCHGVDAIVNLAGCST